MGVFSSSHVIQIVCQFQKEKINDNDEKKKKKKNIFPKLTKVYQLRI